MKPIKVVVIGIAVMFVSIALILSCDNGGAADPTDADIQKLGEAIAVAFDDWDLEEPPYPDEIEVTGDLDNGTITFTDYVDPISGVTVNGSVAISTTESDDTASISLSGTLTFSGAGAPVESIAFDVTITADMSDPNPDNWTITFSGTVTIDGTKFNASGFEVVILGWWL